MNPSPGRLLPIISIALIASCGSERSPAPVTGQADNVTIYRDAWGVPHVHGRSDADAAFGMAYAQAEDNFAQLELNFILALGRSAEVFGEETVLSDWVVHSFETVELSRRDYEQAEPGVKALLDGYAAGLNHYAALHPQAGRRLLDRFEPWYTLALVRRMYYIGGFLGRLRFTTEERTAAFEAINGAPLVTAQLDLPAYASADRSAFGSNSWAATGSKIADGGAYLFTNPHLPAFGMGQVYEAHVMSDDGWNFSGYTRFGFVMPYVGTGEYLGWASTDNFGDQEDAWIETFDDDANPLAYRYADGYRQATERRGQIAVRGGRPIDVRYRRTHHGPVVALRDGKFLSARMATFDEPGWLDQWYAMTRATDLDTFITAVRPLQMQFGNFMYADRDGNIFYVYNGAFPRRDPAFDWNLPVDGSDPATEWDGYHSLDEIPQVLNPASRYMQNTNTTPFMTSMSDSDPRPGDFPAYLVREGDNARSRNARRILAAHDTFDFATWERASFDTTLAEWQVSRPLILDAWQAAAGTDPERDERLRPVVEALEGWDGVADLEDELTAIYADWYEALYDGTPRGDEPTADDIVAALDRARDRLAADWGDWRIAWGEVNRAQRAPLDERGNPLFSDDQPGIATPGVPSWSGGSQIDFNRRQDGLKRRYKAGGNSYTSISWFPADRDEMVALRSVHVFGASADPDSPHYMDQARLLAAGRYKDAWLYLDDVRANAVRSYRPGRE